MAQRSSSTDGLPDSFEELWEGDNVVYDILGERHGEEVAERARDEFGVSVPAGEPEERARWVESKLYRLMPERFYEEPFDSDHLNAIYSSVRTSREKSTGDIPDSIAGWTIDLDRHDAVVLDHSVILQVFDREVHPYYNGGRKEVRYTDALQFLDEVLGRTDALLYVPSDLSEKIDGDPNHWENEEPRKLLEDAALTFDIVEDPEALGDVPEEKVEDYGIGCAAEGLGVSPVVATYDPDFLSVRNRYGIEAGMPVTGGEDREIPV